MKFLLLLAIIGAIVIAWRMRVVLLARITGQSESRIRRQIGGK